MIWICINFGAIRAVMAELLHKGDISHGVHWNIFLILAAIMIIAIFIPNCVMEYAYSLAIVISVVYQLALKYGLETYILDWDIHKDFFGKNSIGIFQTFGYLSCYLIGVGFGRKIYIIATENRPDEDKAFLYKCLELMLLCFVVFIISYFAFEPTAPKPCNLAYVGYELMMCGFCFLVALIPERMIINVPYNLAFDGPSRTSRLIYFTLANIFTGIVNISLNIEELHIGIQLAIILLYMFVLHGVFLLLVMFKINVRCW